MKRRIKYGKKFRMNNFETCSIALSKMKMSRFLYLGEKRQDNPKGNEQSEYLTPSS